MRQVWKQILEDIAVIKLQVQGYNYGNASKTNLFSFEGENMEDTLAVPAKVKSSKTIDSCPFPYK